VNGKDLAAYVYALLGGQSYTQRFWNELETPGPRVPVTKDGELFGKAVALGRRLIWLHTYAEWFRGEDRGDEVPAASARNITPVSSDPAKYPLDYAYNPDKREVRVGDGGFGPVAPEIWEFEVSGLKVVQSWLGYRTKARAGKKSSALDEIRPERWTPRMTDELLELLWVLEATLAMEPELSAALDAVVAGECLKAEDLPQRPRPSGVHRAQKLKLAAYCHQWGQMICMGTTTRLGTHSNPCDHYGCEGETREIVLRMAVISGCDAPPVLELAEHSFDEISAFVGPAVQGIGRPA
jgi:hypothetical protein